MKRNLFHVSTAGNPIRNVHSLESRIIKQRQGSAGRVEGDDQEIWKAENEVLKMDSTFDTFIYVVRTLRDELCHF